MLSRTQALLDERPVQEQPAAAFPPIIEPDFIQVAIDGLAGHLDRLEEHGPALEREREVEPVCHD